MNKFENVAMLGNSDDQDNTGVPTETDDQDSWNSGKSIKEWRAGRGAV